MGHKKYNIDYSNLVANKISHILIKPCSDPPGAETISDSPQNSISQMNPELHQKLFPLEFNTPSS